jgi:hypothetical protein
MAITFATSVKSNSASDADTFTTGSVDTSGATLLVFIMQSNENASTPSDSKGNTWTLAVAETAFFQCKIFYAYNPTVGTGHTFTLTGTDFAGNMQLLAFNGVQAAPDPLDKTNHAANFGVASLSPGSVTPATDGQVLVTGLNDSGDYPSTVNAGYSTPYGQGANVFGFIGGWSAYLIQTSAAASAPTWSLNTGSNNMYTTIATFKAAAAAAQDTPELYARPRDRRLRQILAQ